MSSSIWDKLLTAPSTSEAIERASHQSLHYLQQIALPIPFDEMSPNAQENLKAICRAFEVTLGGIESHGWGLWTHGADELDDWEKGILEIKQKRVSLEVSEIIQTPDTSGAKKPEIENQTVKDGVPQTMNISGDSRQPKQVNALDTKNDRADGTHPEKTINGDETKELDPEEKKNAELIKNWALLSPHKDPPQKAIEQVLRSVQTSRILQYIVPIDSNPLMRAAVISSFTEKIGSTAANVIMAETIIPYVETLKAPAPREVMTAIVNFCKFHWRAAVALYVHFAHSDQRVNGATAELLGRVAAETSPEAALLALNEYSTCTWGEDGIKVIEALMAKATDRAGVIGAIVPSLEKNVIGMEKSVRFGKLLFTMIKDFPVVENEYEQVLEAVATRSQVFLAKRALSFMKDKQQQQQKQYKS